MRGNKLYKLHVLPDFILKNLFVKNNIHQSVCSTRMWEGRWKGCSLLIPYQVVISLLVVVSFHCDPI